jgi:hypothetical protein
MLLATIVLLTGVQMELFPIARTSLTLWEGEDITNKDIGEKYVRKICYSQRMNQSWPSGTVTAPKATAGAESGLR